LKDWQKEKLGSASNKGIADCNGMPSASSEDSDDSLYHKKCACSIAFHKVKTGVTNDMVLLPSAFQLLHNPAFGVFFSLPQ